MQPWSFPWENWALKIRYIDWSSCKWNLGEVWLFSFNHPTRFFTWPIRFEVLPPKQSYHSTFSNRRWSSRDCDPNGVLHICVFTCKEAFIPDVSANGLIKVRLWWRFQGLITFCDGVFNCQSWVGFLSPLVAFVVVLFPLPQISHTSKRNLVSDSRYR